MAPSLAPTVPPPHPGPTLASSTVSDSKSVGFPIGERGRIRFPAETDPTPEAVRLLLLLFFLQSGVDAHGNCPWPGGWVAQGRKRHGWRARAYKDVFTASPAQPTLPANPQQPSISTDHPEGLRRWLDIQMPRKRRRPSAGPGRFRASGQAGIRIPASLHQPVRWPWIGRRCCGGLALRPLPEPGLPVPARVVPVRAWRPRLRLRRPRRSRPPR
ncbi:hypothetical protein SAMN05720615_10312 [Stenotrophomonas indicatrix]|nr:hypothetical protein SAMN05720615_10312 [Stenotrophomonas indicatrix]